MKKIIFNVVVGAFIGGISILLAWLLLPPASPDSMFFFFLAVTVISAVVEVAQGKKPGRNDGD